MEKYNRRDELITKEHLMAEALSSHNSLFLENKWITHDPKHEDLTKLISRAETMFENCSQKCGGGGGGCKNDGKLRKSRVLKVIRSLTGSLLH